jgi:hypothetical protein
MTPANQNRFGLVWPLSSLVPFCLVFHAIAIAKVTVYLDLRLGQVGRQVRKTVLYKFTVSENNATRALPVAGQPGASFAGIFGDYNLRRFDPVEDHATLEFFAPVSYRL